MTALENGTPEMDLNSLLGDTSIGDAGSAGGSFIMPELPDSIWARIVANAMDPDTPGVPETLLPDESALPGEDDPDLLYLDGVDINPDGSYDGDLPTDSTDGDGSDGNDGHPSNGHPTDGHPTDGHPTDGDSGAGDPENGGNADDDSGNGGPADGGDGSDIGDSSGAGLDDSGLADDGSGLTGDGSDFDDFGGSDWSGSDSLGSDPLGLDSVGTDYLGNDAVGEVHPWSDPDPLDDGNSTAF